MGARAHVGHSGNFEMTEYKLYTEMNINSPSAGTAAVLDDHGACIAGLLDRGEEYEQTVVAIFPRTGLAV